MAEFLVLANDSPAQESDAKWRAGRIVVIMPDDHEWGGQEGMPKFYLIKVPGVAVADAKAYIDEWNHSPSFSLDNSNPTIDGYRYTMTSSAVAAGGKGSLTLSKVRNFFESWGASMYANTSSSITFDFTIYDLVTSEKFWSKDVSVVTFSETSYNEQTGEHVVEVVTESITDAQIERNCLINEVEYVAPRSFKVTRNQARNMMQSDIERALKGVMVDRRRWYVTAAGMTALAKNGGVISVTPSQFINNIRDGWLD